MLKDHSTLYIFTDCKELITRNLVDGQSILLRRKRAMTMLVPFSGKYCFHGRMEMEAGDPRDCQGLSLPSFHLQLLSLRKKESPDLQHRTINRLKHTIINHCTLFYLISYDYHSFIYQFNFWLSSKISKV